MPNTSWAVILQTYRMLSFPLSKQLPIILLKDQVIIIIFHLGFWNALSVGKESKANITLSSSLVPLPERWNVCSDK